MTTLKKITIAALILGVLLAVTATWHTASVMAGFTPTPPPPTTPQPPPKEPKDTPTPTAVNLTVTPDVMPVTGGLADGPGVKVALVLGMIVLLAAGLRVSRLSRSRE
jgi:hypothetical protein